MPLWTWGVILAGGILAHVGVGHLLEGRRFDANLEALLENPAAFLNSGTETIAPLVLLLIPAVLGGMWTRDTLRVILRGLARKDPPWIIAKDVALFALSFIVLIIVGLTTSSKPRYP